MPRLASRASLLAVPIAFLLTGAAIANAPPTLETLATTARPSSTPQRLAILIKGGCPANLDKVCHRNRRGKMMCHCQS